MEKIDIHMSSFPSDVVAPSDAGVPDLPEMSLTSMTLEVSLLKNGNCYCTVGLNRGSCIVLVLVVKMWLLKLNGCV